MKKYFYVILILFSTQEIFSRDDELIRIKGDYHFYAPLTYFDYPFNDKITDISVHSFYDLTDAITQSSNYLIEEIESTRIKYPVLIGWDFLLSYTMGILLHESSHNSVLELAGIPAGFSITGWGSGGTGPWDPDPIDALNNFKKDNPANSAHLFSAGLETNGQFNRILAARAFNFNTRSNDFAAMWLNNTWRSNYTEAGMNQVKTASKKVISGKLDNYRSGINFDSGLWLYELYNPDKPLAVVDKDDPSNFVFSAAYWKPTEEELKYLEDAVNLDWINYFNPQLFGIRRIDLGPLYFNFAPNFSLAPFGYQYLLDLYFLPKFNGQRYMLSFVANTNQNNKGYGFIFKQTALEVPMGDITYEIQGWEQPENLLFKDKMKKGGMLAVTYNLSFEKYVDLSFQVGYKSKGFILGNAYLKETLFGSFGIVTKF
ncbi:MAG: hypothetical protein ACRCSK_06525 [Fusobacteriaceae bacterium]